MIYTILSSLLIWTLLSVVGSCLVGRFLRVGAASRDEKNNDSRDPVLRPANYRHIPL